MKAIKTSHNNLIRCGDYARSAASRCFVGMGATFLLLLGLAIAPCAAGQNNVSALGPVGTVWGGEHVRLEVTPEGATLEFDCASGSTTKPVELSSPGNFSTAGTYTRERGGPVTRDGNPSVPAMYSGSIEGNTLKLTVTAGPQNESAGGYVLYRGKPGHVLKCR